MNLSEKQRDELWGVEGPYSETRLTIETRILDDSVSRIFVVVEASINPFTYRIIKRNRKKFSDDEMIQQLLDNSSYRGMKYGYVTCSFIEQLIPEEDDKIIMKRAQESLEYTKKTIIKMHEYVIKKISGAFFFDNV